MKTFGQFLKRFHPDADKPSAILTAFRGERTLKQNQAANKLLEKNMARLGLKYHSALGAGQEPDKKGENQIAYEESYIVEPSGKMSNEEFLDSVRELLFNKDNPDHRQWGAMVNIPGEGNFLLHHPHDSPKSVKNPSEYSRRKKHSLARPHEKSDSYFTLRGKNGFTIA